VPMENCLICGICHGRGREFENQVDDCYLLIDLWSAKIPSDGFQRNVTLLHSDSLPSDPSPLCNARCAAQLDRRIVRRHDSFT
jgi:hypothetical protein